MSTQTINPLEIQKAAGLYCQGMTLGDIAQSLACDESDVERMIEYAEQEQYFRLEPTLSSDNLDPQVREFIDNEILTSALSHALQDKIELTLTQLTVTPSPPELFTTYRAGDTPGSEEREAYLNAERRASAIVCQRAAQEVSQHLFDGKSHVVGLNWGLMVREIVQRLRPRPSDLGQAQIRVVSLFGDLEFATERSDVPAPAALDINCNTLVTQLAKQLGRAGQAVTLNVPGFVPARFAQNEAAFQAIRDFMTSHSSYRRIFPGPPEEQPGRPRSLRIAGEGTDEALISHMDSILTGLGAADNYTILDHYLQALLDAEESEQLGQYCREGKVVGDIGGHLVESKKGSDDNQLMDFLTHVNRRILAAVPADFVDVASRNRKTGDGAGVTVATAGARKSKILITLLSWEPCPISRLVIDTHCALALLHEVDPAAFKKFLRDEGRPLVANHAQWSDGTRALIPV